MCIGNVRLEYLSTLTSLLVFLQAVPLIETWGVKIPDPVATFQSIDTDHGGMILFAEFADWALKMSLGLPVHKYTYLLNNI